MRPEPSAATALRCRLGVFNKIVVLWSLKANEDYISWICFNLLKVR